ncbi:MAG: BamA/TamA family outer membrane protein [Hydrogenothermaceae bacterium]|nr:BamA/TamA family outer membrane protein [Hydrogenothermaceae bacterium]
MRKIIYLLLVFFQISTFYNIYADTLEKSNWKEIYEKTQNPELIEKLLDLSGDFKKVEFNGKDFIFEKKPIVKSIDIKGNRSFWDSEIKALTGLIENYPFDEELIKVIPLRIRQFYADNGFFFANVNLDYKLKDNYAYFTIKIDEGKKSKLRDINFISDQEVSSVDKITFKKVMGLKEGKTVKFSDLQNSLDTLQKYLHSIGYFESSVELLDIEDATDGYINLFISINFGTKYIVRFNGNKSIPEEKLKNLLTFYEESFNYYQLGLSLQKIIEEYYNNGFLNIHLNFNVEESSDTVENLYPVFTIIDINIDEGEKFKVKNISIDTDSDEVKNDILNLLKDGVYRKSEVVEYLKNKVSNFTKKGYLSAFYGIEEEITSENSLDLKIKLFKNQRYILRSVKFDGYKPNEKIKVNTFYDPNKLIEFQERLREESKDNGYLDGEVLLDVNITPDKEYNFVDAVYKFNLGERYKNGFTFVYGSRFINPNMITTQFPTEDEFYRKDKVDNGLNRLYDSKLFDSLNLYTLEDRDKKIINKAIVLHDDKRGLFQGSIGYSTDQQLKVSILAVFKNLFGYGFEASTYFERSNFQTNYRLSLANRLLPYNFSAVTSGYSSNQYRRFFNLEQKGYELSVDKKNNLWTTTTISFSHTSNKLSNISIPTNLTDYSLNKISISITDDHRNPKIDTKSGYFITGRVENSWGKKSFTRAEISGRYFIPFFDRVVFSQRVMSGYTFTDINNLPLSERYFLGGISSMRGFGLEELAGESNIGGNSFILLNNDLRVLVYPKYNLYLFTFFDLGNVYKDKREFSDLKLRKTTGIGVYVPTPVGSLIFDIAKKIERLPGESLYRLEFSIGANF